MEDKFINLLKNDECVTEEMMLKYHGDVLSPADRHRIERHLIECDFCSDAMEGLASQNLSDTKDSLRRLDQRLDQRISEPKGGAFQRQWIFRIAAVVVLVSLFGGGYYYLQSIKKSERVFTENFEPFHDSSYAASPAALAPQAETEAMKQKDASSSLSKKEKPREQVGNAVVANEKTRTITSAVEEANKKDDLEDAKTTAVTEFSLDNKGLDFPTRTAENPGTVLSDESTSEDKFSVKQPPAMKAMRENANSGGAANNEAMVSKKSLGDTGSIVVVTGTAASVASNNLVPDGIKQYEAKNYSDAISLFNTALENDKTNTEALFYNGVSHLSNNENKDAIHLLESVVNNSPNKFSDAAKWYLSLAYLKERKIVRAKNILEDLSGTKNEYQGKAKKALEELK